MELLCIQSQEHPQLPLAELRAVMECEDIQADVDVICEGLVILKNISEEDLCDYYEILTRRLGYTHEVHELISRSSVESFEEDISSIDWNKYIDENFAVRVKRINSQIDTVETERWAGTLILANSENVKVKLRHPNTLIRIASFENELFAVAFEAKADERLRRAFTSITR